MDQNEFLQSGTNDGPRIFLKKMEHAAFWVDAPFSKRTRELEFKKNTGPFFAGDVAIPAHITSAESESVGPDLQPDEFPSFLVDNRPFAQDNAQDAGVHIEHTKNESFLPRIFQPLTYSYHYPPPSFNIGGFYNIVKFICRNKIFLIRFKL